MAEPATTSGEAEAGVLRSLLEEGEDPPGGGADISLMAKDASATTAVQIDVNTLVAQQHAAAHQARAAAALEQADAAEERHHQDQQQQQQQQKQQQQQQQQHQQQQQQYHHQDATSQLQHQVTIASSSPPLIATQSLPQQQVTTSQATPIVIPSSTADLENETSLTPGSPDLTLSSIPAPSMSICLCQQPARIPRPRNAFILFRQHNQAAVVAQHPGKPNPEISKIIGEMWRESPQETKNIWQKHADEEKKQHLARYPEYRYQPRRNGKKNAAAAAAAFSSAGASGALSPSIETTVCSTCGGRTGTLSTPQTPATPSSAVPKTPRLPPPPHISRPPSAAPPPAKKRRTGNSDDTASQTSPGAGPTSGVGVVDQAGVEALLQLGHLQNEDEPNSGVVSELQTPLKKRKLNEGSPMPGIIETTPLQQQSFYTHLTQPSHDPNIDPFLRQNGFESESPTTLDHDGNLTTGPHHHQLPSFTAQLPDTYVIKSIPVLEKIHAFSKICKPLSPISGPGFPRMPIVAIEGEDIETVTDLFHALAKDIRKSEPLEVIDEPEIFAPAGLAVEEADIEGLLIPTGLDSTNSNSLVPVGSSKDKDRYDDDSDAAKYLSHVASWRRRCIDIKKTVLPPPGADGTASVNIPFGEDSGAAVVSSVLLVNRYMVSRSDVAASRLSADGLTPIQHWQWCATVWRGCVGADMTIYVSTVPEGGVRGDDPVEMKDGGRVVFVRKEEGGGGRKEWDEKIVRRLGFEVGEVVRSLRGFGG